VPLADSASWPVNLPRVSRCTPAVAGALRISRAYRAEGPEFMDARMSDAF
jgi:hypothetical protein